ncbi:MAG TPA: ABC transporter ATP-binding protein, partial [Tepidiformaceae bacterium]|nr:ABC transporter ATP-binding protein [Tepidiformaceae bacterium]
MPPAISASGIRKRYGALEALRGVDLEVAEGEVFALLGPNGAGKTTFVEILEGFRERSAGEAAVLGVDPLKGGAEWRARLGIVLQSAGFFEHLTPDEAVAHFAKFYPHPLDPGRVINMVGLADKRSDRVKHLSGGQKRRGGLGPGVGRDPDPGSPGDARTGPGPPGRRPGWGG